MGSFMPASAIAIVGLGQAEGAGPHAPQSAGAAVESFLGPTKCPASMRPEEGVRAELRYRQHDGSGSDRGGEEDRYVAQMEAADCGDDQRHDRSQYSREEGARELRPDEAGPRDAGDRATEHGHPKP